MKKLKNWKLNRKNKENKQNFYNNFRQIFCKSARKTIFFDEPFNMIDNNFHDQINVHHTNENIKIANKLLKRENKI